MIYLVLAIISVLLFAMETGIFAFSFRIVLDLLYFDVGFLRLRLRVSLATICLAASWFLGLNEVIAKYIAMPVWAAMICVFLVIPSLFATLFEKPKSAN